MTKTIQIKRAYEPPARGDGRRVLVERLWPRGMKKEQLVLDDWLKDVAPSTALRQWYGHRVERWPEFRRRYRSELRRAPACERLLRDAQHGKLTLLFSAHDPVHNSAHVLRDYLERRIARNSEASRGSRVWTHAKRRVRGRPARIR
ncbi:MAG TPA: DUF488 family protein [Kofleriaceae bacterium]|jgi:uncharacterized protein YeaO (DUF488 family)|nr:DUF488 family protein [Kofleriaceae bacterium]